MPDSMEQVFETTCPWIPWRQPVTVETPSARTDFACRFCIAMLGLRGEDVGKLPATREEFDRHMASNHPLGKWSDFRKD